MNWQIIKDYYREIGTIIPIGHDKRPIGKNWQQADDFHISMFTDKCGLRPHAGLVVIDVDVKGSNGFETLEALGVEWGRTLHATTPSGGAHLWYKIDPSIELKNSVGALAGIDLRVAGKGQVVVFPSAGYTWQDLDLDSMERPTLDLIEPIPEELLTAIMRASAVKDYTLPTGGNSGIVGEGGRNDYLARVAGKLWDAGIGTYKNLLSVLLDRNATDCNPPLPHDEVDGIARSISRYTAPDLVEYHQAVEHGTQVAHNLIKNYQEKIAAELATTGTHFDEIKTPDTLVPKHGLLKHMVEAICDQSVRPQPLLALSASMAFIGAIAGQKYRSPTDLRTNIYMIGLADTGHGKDQARKVINVWASQAQLDKYMGGEDFASGQAIISSLQNHPSKLFMIDEFGLMMQSYTSTKAASHQKEIITNLLKLYSSSAGVFRGREYADQKMRPTHSIHNPNACLFGTSTPSTFFEALKSGDALSGTLPRFIVVQTSSTRPPRQRSIRIIKERNDYIVQNLKAIGEFQGMGAGNLSGLMPNSITPLTIPIDESVQNMIDDLDDGFDIQMTDEVTKAIYTRVVENLTKIAMIYAIAKDHLNPHIDAEAYEWAKDFVLYSSNMMINATRDNVSDNMQESQVKRLLNVIKGAGAKGIDRSQLIKKTQWLKARERNEIINDLLESQQVLQHLDATSTKPRQVLYFNFKKQ